VINNRVLYESSKEKKATTIASVDEKTSPHSMTGNSQVEEGHREIINDLCLFSRALLTQGFFQSSTTILFFFHSSLVFLRKESFEISFFSLSLVYTVGCRQKKDSRRLTRHTLDVRFYSSVLSMHKTL